MARMSVTFIGDDPRLEALHEDRRSEATVVITHPHSLMGGTMHNNVVMTAWRVSLDRGLSAVRFNFRGVGRSGGSFDEGNGEMEDLRAVIAHVKTPVIVIGYSFGAWVASRLMNRLERPLPAIYISPPTAMFTFGSMKDAAVWALTGSDDQFCNVALLESLLDRGRLTVVPGVDHFWFGDEDTLADRLGERLDLMLETMV